MASRNTATDGHQSLIADNRFKLSSPLGFVHIVNAQKATLEVQVLGPNLGFNFEHSRMRQARIIPSRIAKRLERKTTGLLALVPSSPCSKSGGEGDDKQKPSLSTSRLTVLAWAESGHGAGKFGDLIDAGAGSYALSNAIWSRRAIKLARLLRVPFKTIFDKDSEGIFRGSHVEIQLATHAVYVLLRLFPRPTTTSDSTAGTKQGQGSEGDLMVMQRRLMALRGARWSEGSRPAFNIIFSRKDCHCCRIFVERLSQLTGIEMRLIWGTRLTPYIYETRNFDKAREVQKSGSNNEWEDMELDEDDEDDSEDDGKDRAGDKGNEAVPDLPAPPNPDDTNDVNHGRRRERASGTQATPWGVAKPLPATPELEAPQRMAPAVRERARRRWHAWGPGGGDCA